jgi:hypothetical protein
MMTERSFLRVATIVLCCAAVALTSCSKSFVYRTPVKSNSGYGPPPHAPAHGYRRKQGQTVVVAGATPVIVESSANVAKDDAGDTKKLAVAGAVAAGVGTVYAVANERDKRQTQAELNDLRQEMNVVHVNVTNSNGSISQVRLEKQGVGYVGPKGEFYDHLPTGEELKATYAF